MKKSFILLCILLIGLLEGLIIYFFHQKLTLLSPLGKPAQNAKPLLAYTFENLKRTHFPVSKITLGRKVSETPDSFSQMFYFFVPKKPNSYHMEKVSGLINLPKQKGSYPVIVMFRGYVPLNIYNPGIGSEPVAQVFAKHGFITLAPDFLGYGESASASADGFEARFQTYTTALTLLASLKSLNSGLNASYSGSITADMTKIGIWGHSNGGHIALATLAISSVTYPTVLWAPVSTSFPYSILYYTNETDDQGKALRKALALFEEMYNADLFSPPRYYAWIHAPIEINQGTIDHEVPFWWSDDLVETLKKDHVDVTYITYPQADHNLLPNGWTEAVQNSMSFYNRYFNKQ